ncbi:putative ABC transporter permease [bacterium]|nr:putative ABC transporter permease [bacterium]
MTKYIFMFLTFSFLGWILDTTYCSLFIYKKFTPSGYYKNIPICPVYGLGGILIYALFVLFQNVPGYWVIPITSIAVIALEYFAGMFCEDVLKERLWDYSDKKYHLNGYITLENSIYWILIVLGLYWLIGSKIYILTDLLSDIDSKIGALDVFIACPFMIFLYELTIYTRDKRLGFRTKSELYKKIEELESKDLGKNWKEIQQKLKRKILGK